MAVSYFHLNQSIRKIELLRCRYLQQQFKSLGVHPNQLPILEHVGRHGGCTQVEISRDLALTPAAIALATKRLQKDGLLQKKADAENLRQNRLTLTDRGERVRQETKEILLRFDRIMYAGLTQAELEAFGASLDRIATNITGEETNAVDAAAMARLIQDLQKEDTAALAGEEAQTER